MADITGVADVGDVAGNGGPVNFLGVVEFVATGITGGVDVTEVVFGLVESADEVAFHNLAMIEIEQNTDAGTADSAHDIQGPFETVAAIALMVDAGIEHFQVEIDCGGFGFGGDLGEQRGGMGAMFGVADARLAITGEDDEVADAVRRGLGKAGTDFGQDACVFARQGDAAFQGLVRADAGDGQAMAGGRGAEFLPVRAALPMFDRMVANGLGLGEELVIGLIRSPKAWRDEGLAETHR